LSRKKTELSRKRSRSFAAKTVSVRKSEASRSSSSTTTATEKKFLVKTGGPRPDPQRCPEAAQRSAVGACCVPFFSVIKAQVKREPDSTTGAVVGPLLIAANHVRNRALSRALSTTIPDIRARAEAAVAQQRKTALSLRCKKTMDNVPAYAVRNRPRSKLSSTPIGVIYYPLQCWGRSLRESQIGRRPGVALALDSDDCCGHV